MRRSLLAVLLALLICATVSPAGAGDTGYLAVSLFDPVQYPGSATSIVGIRFNLFYGRNHNLTGLDLGVPSFLTPLNTLNGTLYGIQSGFYNEAKRVHPMGFQWGTVNYTREHFGGLQLAGGNITGDTVTGVQIGIVNRAGVLRGVQIGGFNYTGRLKGLQLGLSNLRGRPRGGASGAAPYRFFPLVNWAF